MDFESPEFKKAMHDLRSQALSETAELRQQVTNALQPHYWQGLNPGMSLRGSELFRTQEDVDFDASRIERSLQTFAESGYFQTPPIASASSVERMRNCLETTQGAGWHPAFVFVYDDFWSAFRGPTIVRFLTGALGPNYGQLPYLWGHRVTANARGWHPHVDGPTPLEKLTVWLALTDATLENGCMYVIPRNSETERISDEYSTIPSIDRDSAKNFFKM